MSTNANVHVDSVDIHLDGLDDIKADVKADLKADLGLGNIKADLGLGGIKADVKADLKTDSHLAIDELRADIVGRLRELAPIFFNFLWKEIPIVRIGFPHRYKVGFSLCGKEVFAVTLCGESEIITETNRCGDKAQNGVG